MKKWLQRLYSKKFLPDTILQQAAAARAEEELKILHTDFSAAWQFFKENYKSNYNLPLYLIIGQSNFGKTTLLAKSGLGLHDIYGNEVQNNLSTRYCVWLFSHLATFLDTAGVYSTSNKDNPHDNLVWLGFLRFLRGRFWHNPVSGVIIVIDMPTLLGDPNKLHKVLHDARERLYEIAQYVDTLPVSIVFTKTDVLSGFTDFFADLSSEERKQPFGINFSRDNKHVNPQQTLATAFASMLSVLQEKLYKRLHQEEDFSTRLKIQNFFGQFAALHPALATVLSEIPYGGHIVLHGCYFVSGLQDANSDSIDNVMASVPQDIQDSVLSQTAQPSSIKYTNKSYFIEDLFSQEILENKVSTNIEARKTSWSEVLLTLILALCLGIAALAWHSSYKKSSAVFDEEIKVLQDKTQPEIARLEQAIGIADVNSGFWWAHIGLSHVHKLNESLNKIYYKKFSTDVTAQLQKTLEEELTVTELMDYKYLYDTLKTYIMLGDSSKMDIDYVKGWFEKYWQKKYANNLDQSRHLTKQLAMILPQGITIKPAAQIISTARSMLNSHNIPKEDLVYSVLEKEYSHQNLVFKFDDKEIKISKLYTADNLAKVYDKQIPQMAYSLSRKNGDWVLLESDEAQPILPQADMDKLVANLRALYLKNYIDAWNNTSQDIKIPDFSEIKKMQRFAADVSNSNYPLLSFLKMMQINLSSKDAPPEFRKLVDAKIVGIYGADIKSIYSGISGLNDYLSKITSSSDVDKTAFNLASTKFQAGDGGNDEITKLRVIADAEPKLIRDWLQSISDSAWKSMLTSSKNYINVMWSANVLPEYSTVINDTYPFFKNANKSINAGDLAKFFAQNGLIATFFNNYLRPFVDTDQVYWTWKNVDGQVLNMGQDKLEVFIRAALIRKMFYPNGGSVPEVKFTLIARALTPNTQRFSLNVGGQVISYTKGQKMIDNLVWPGPTPDLVSVGFINGQGKAINSAMPHDIWGLFRLLDKANLKPIEGTQRFGFTVDLNGNAAQYEMDVEQPINPFIAGVLDSFRCPDKL